MSFLEDLGLVPTLTAAEASEKVKAKIKRIRWAFNGEDGDSVHVGIIVDSYERMLDQSGYLLGKMHECSSEKERIRYGATGPVAEPIAEGMAGMGKAIRQLEDLAATRVVAQGRWFTDKDGPDYVAPSVENPQDN